MTDRDALYAAVLARPDDDTPRLVFADYLDDTGAHADAVRARFIRNQVALARAEPWSDEYDRLSRTTVPVEFHNAKEWAADLEGLVLAQGNVYRRGFVEQVTCYSKRFVADGAAIFERHPVRVVKFVDTTGGRGAAPAKALAGCPHLARVHTAHLVGDKVNDDFIEAFTDSPHVKGLRCLRVSNSTLGRAGMGCLNPRHLPALDELDLRGNRNVTDAEVTALVSFTHNTWFRVLDLSHCGTGPSIVGLIACRQASRMEVLRLSHTADFGGTPIRGPGAVALAESPHLRGLKELELHGQELRKRGSEAFAAAYAWPCLKRLGLRGNQIPGSAIPAFAANPHLRSLAEIDFRSNPIRQEDLAALRESCPHTRFRTDDAERPIPITRLAPEDRP